MVGRGWMAAGAVAAVVAAWGTVASSGREMGGVKGTVGLGVEELASAAGSGAGDNSPAAQARQRATQSGRGPAGGGAPMDPAARKALQALMQKEGELLVAAATPLMVLEGPKDVVAAVAFSPDGKMLAAGGGEGKVTLFDAATGKELRTLSAEGGVIDALSWSPDGSKLATGDYDGKINVWDAAKGEIVDHHEQRCPVINVVFLPDGKRLVSICGEVLRWWSVGKGPELFHRSISDAGGIWALGATAGGQVVASDQHGLVAVLNGETGAEIAHDAGRSSLPWDAKTATWVMAIYPLKGNEVMLADGAEVWTWDWKLGTKKPLVGSGAWYVGVSPDGKLLFKVLADQGLAVDDIPGENRTGNAPQQEEQINGVAVSPRGDRVAVASGGEQQGNGWKSKGKAAVFLYDEAKWEALRAFKEKRKAGTATP